MRKESNEKEHMPDALWALDDSVSYMRSSLKELGRGRKAFSTGPVYMLFDDETARGLFAAAMRRQLKAHEAQRKKLLHGGKEKHIPRRATVKSSHQPIAAKVAKLAKRLDAIAAMLEDGKTFEIHCPEVFDVEGNTIGVAVGDESLQAPDDLKVNEIIREILVNERNRISNELGVLGHWEHLMHA